MEAVGRLHFQTASALFFAGLDQTYSTFKTEFSMMQQCGLNEFVENIQLRKGIDQ
jgi:hypothetical protein